MIVMGDKYGADGGDRSVIIMVMMASLHHHTTPAIDVIVSAAIA
jgi:hypothetical protein